MFGEKEKPIIDQSKSEEPVGIVKESKVERPEVKEKEEKLVGYAVDTIKAKDVAAADESTEKTNKVVKFAKGSWTGVKVVPTIIFKIVVGLFKFAKDAATGKLNYRRGKEISQEMFDYGAKRDKKA